MGTVRHNRGSTLWELFRAWASCLVMVLSRCLAGARHDGGQGVGSQGAAGGQTFPLRGLLLLVLPGSRGLPRGWDPPACPSPARGTATVVCPSFGRSVCPASGSARSRVPAPGEPRPPPGTGPAPVCARIMVLYFHEVGSTGCAGRRRQPRGMKALTSHTHGSSGSSTPASPSARHSVSALPAGDREGARISSAMAPANPPAPGCDAGGAKSLQGCSEPRMDSCC